MTGEVSPAGVDSVEEAVQAEQRPSLLIDIAAYERIKEAPPSPIRLPEEGAPDSDALARRLGESDPSPLARAAQLHALSAAGEPTRIEAFAQALEDDDPDVRATAVAVLARRPSGPIVDLLLHALDDRDERVWRTAPAPLGENPPARAPEVVGRAAARRPGAE